MAERWQTWAAIVSAVVAAVALALSWQWNQQNDEVTARQEARLDVQEQRLDRQEVEQYASKVYLGEAPQYFYEEFGGRPAVGEITWVVINARARRSTALGSRARRTRRADRPPSTSTASNGARCTRSPLISSPSHCTSPILTRTGADRWAPDSTVGISRCRQRTRGIRPT